MAEFDNHTPYTAHAAPGWSHDGEAVLAVAVKAVLRFDDRGRLTLAKAPAELELTDRFRGHPQQSGVAAANECVPRKLGGEVIVNATAQTDDHDLRVMEADFAMQSPHQGIVRGAHLGITGPRRYERGLFGLSVSKPERIEPLPVIPEHAFGGTHPDNPGDAYPENPVGCGYWRRRKDADGQPLPQIQWHKQWVTAPSQRPKPAIIAALAPHWEPRRKERGTHNEVAAQGTGCPIGRDATAAYYNSAPPHQRFPQPFRGGEIVTLTNLVEGQPFNQPFTLTLPALRPEATLFLGQTRSSLELVHDTVVIEAGRREIHLLFHAMAPWRLTERRRAFIVLNDPSLAGPDNQPLLANL